MHANTANSICSIQRKIRITNYSTYILQKYIHKYIPYIRRIYRPFILVHLHFWSSNHRRFNLFSAFSTSAGFCREDHETPVVTQLPSAGGEGIWIRRHKPPLTPKAKRAHHERGGVASRFAVSFSCHLTTSLLSQKFKQPFETGFFNNCHV